MFKKFRVYKMFKRFKACNADFKEEEIIVNVIHITDISDCDLKSKDGSIILKTVMRLADGYTFYLTLSPKEVREYIES